VEFRQGSDQYAGSTGTVRQFTKEGGSVVPSRRAQTAIRDYTSGEVVVNTAESVVEAPDLEVRYRTSFWDVLILHSALHCGATILYMEDLATGQKYGAIQVVNPLIAP